MDRERVQGLAFLTLTALAWGLNWPIVKTLLAQLPPFSMRALCGIGFAFGLAAARGENLRVPLGLRQIAALALTLSGVALAARS